MRLGTLCAVVAGASLATGCSSGSDVLSTANALEFCKSKWGLLYEKQADCWKSSAAVVASLKADLETSCARDAHEVAAGRAAYDASKAAACISRLAAMDACAAYVGPAVYGSGSLPEECSAATTGRVAASGDCWSGLDCASGTCWGAGSQPCSGQCVAYAKEGEDCMQPPLCEPGLVCMSRDGVTASCTAPSDAGGPCPCKPGLYCDFGESAVDTATCRAQQKGGFCHASDECAPGYRCMWREYFAECLPVVGEGERCNAAGSCGVGLYCEPGTSICVALPTVGQSCELSSQGTTAELPCLNGWCDTDGTKKCQPRKADGEPCQSWEQCKGICDSTQHCAGASPSQVCAP